MSDGSVVRQYDQDLRKNYSLGQLIVQSGKIVYVWETNRPRGVLSCKVKFRWGKKASGGIIVVGGEAASLKAKSRCPLGNKLSAKSAVLQGQVS